jgi:hypothetical protein
MTESRHPTGKMEPNGWSSEVFSTGSPEAARNRQKEEKMRSKFAMLLAIAAVCATTAWAGWTSESLVTHSPNMMRELSVHNFAHKVVFGTDGVGHLVWEGGPYPTSTPHGVWYNRYNPSSGNRPGYWGDDSAAAPPKTKPRVVGHGTPCIALDGDGRTIHVVWSSRVSSLTAETDSVCYRMCTQDRKGNDKWGATLYLYAAKYIFAPVVACVPNEPNHVLVCWRHLVEIDSSHHSHVTRFREYVNGAWTAVVRLDSSYMAPSGSASIAAAPNGDVFVGYPGYEDGTTGTQILVKTRHNGVWGEPVNVTKSFSSLLCWRHTIEVNPITCNPHVVFEGWTEVPTGAGQDTAVCAVYHTYRNASGVWLTTPELISEPHHASARGHFPTMAFISNGAAYVAWYDSVFVPPASCGIMYSYCSSEGGTWSTPEWLTSYPSGSPFLAVDEARSAVRTVWHRYTLVGDEIWWKSNYLGGGGAMGWPVALPQSGIELFPNPAKAGRVTVHYALPQAGPMTVTLLDVSGRAVRRSAFGVRSSGEGSFNIDVSGLNAGVYVARLVAGDLSVSKSLVVER